MPKTTEEAIIPEQSSTVDSSNDNNDKITAKVNDNSAKLSLFSNRPNTRSNNLSSTPALIKPTGEISDDSSNNGSDDDEEEDLEDENILDYRKKLKNVEVLRSIPH